MVLMIDTNIILDVLQKRTPYFTDSSYIWKLCETKQITGHISSLSFANIVYILRKELIPNKIRDILNALSLIFSIDDLTEYDLKNAAALKWNDYEDAIQTATAIRIHADFILTRNTSDFTQCQIPVITPYEFVKNNHSYGF